MRVTIVIVVIAALLFPAAGLAAIYYIDPDDGDDNLSGADRASAWRNLPGTRRPDNAGFIKAPGWSRIVPGDILLIKSGTTIRNALVIDHTFYGNGTRQRPIRIVRDTSWGFGPVVFDGSSQVLGRWESMISVLKRDYVEIEGSTAGGIVIRHARGGGLRATGHTESRKMDGFRVRNVKLYDNLKFNVVLQRCDGFLLDAVEVDGNRRDTEESGGFHIGGHTYGCSRGRLLNCRSYNNGDTPRSQAGGTDARIGFWLVNSTDIFFENCVAHDNEGDGFDVGVEGSPPSTVTDNIRYINCQSYNNADGFGCNLDDVPGIARVWYVNCISRGNITGWNIYEGADAFVYNSLAAYNRCGIYIDAPLRRQRMTHVEVRNCVFYRNSDGTSGSADLWVHRADGLQLSSDYNHFEGSPGNAASVWNGAYIHDVYRYTDHEAPGSKKRSWYRNHMQDGNSVCSVDGVFARFSDASRHDFRLTAGSGIAGRGTTIDLPEADSYNNGKLKPRSDRWDIGPYLLPAPAPLPAVISSITPST